MPLASAGKSLIVAFSSAELPDFQHRSRWKEPKYPNVVSDEVLRVGRDLRCLLLDRGLNRSTQQFDDIALPVFRSLASFWVAR